MIELYKNIKNRRKEIGMTQAQLAEIAGYADKTMISKIEAGQVDLTQTKIKAIADALRTSPGALMGWCPGPTRSTSFSPEEVELIDGYRALSHEGRAAVRAFVAFTAAGERERESRNSTG